MFKKFVKDIKDLDSELKELYNKIDIDKLDEKNMYLYAKFKILFGKLLLMENNLLNNYNDFKKDRFKWLIRCLLLILLCYICLFLNGNLFMVFSAMIGNIFSSSILLSDLIKHNSYNKTIDYCNNKIECYELYKVLNEKFNYNDDYVKIHEEKKDMINNKEKDLFDEAMNIILFSLYYKNIEICYMTKEVEDMVIKILKSDLNTDENDMNKLLDMVREKNNIENPTLELRR